VPNLLIIEDEKPIRDMLRFALHAAGYEIIEAADSHEARVLLAETVPDLILVDWMLPSGSGIDLVRQIKQDELTQDVPIIMLTARVEDEYKVRGLETGADDYITKPFSMRELLARIRVVLRRSTPEHGDGPFQIGDLVLDHNTQQVTCRDEIVDLGPTEYRLLAFFMAHPERVYSRSQLLDRVWGRSVYVEERTVDVHVRRLRKSLEPFGQHHLIQTVRGTGYRFSEHY